VDETMARLVAAPLTGVARGSFTERRRVLFTMLTALGCPFAKKPRPADKRLIFSFRPPPVPR
jgi:hypothetical protein